MTQPHPSVRRVPRGVAHAIHNPEKQTASGTALPDMTVFVLGHAISVNAAYVGRKPTGRNRGTRRLSDAAVVWREAVITECRAWLNAERAQPATWRLPLAVRITVYGVRGDTDNYAKLICDGLKHALGYDLRTGKLLIDDRHFQSVTITRSAANAVPGCLIEVWQTPTAEGQGAA